MYQINQVQLTCNSSSIVVLTSTHAHMYSTHCCSHMHVQMCTHTHTQVTVSIQLTDQQPPTLETILNYQYFPISRDYEYCNAFNPTCLALEGVVDKADRNDILCNTTEQCDGVLCWFDLLQNGALFPATASLVPCNKPMPAVDIKILDPSKSSKVSFKIE